MWLTQTQDFYFVTTEVVGDIKPHHAEQENSSTHLSTFFVVFVIVLLQTIVTQTFQELSEA